MYHLQSLTVDEALAKADIHFAKKQYAAESLYLNAAARKGSPVAMRKLGGSYMAGLGVSQNGERAISLLTEAANRGDIPAMKLLGWGYTTDLLGKDAEKSRHWYGMAAEHGDIDARNALQP